MDMTDITCKLRSIGAVLAANVAGAITHVETSEAAAALTFDDGPHPEFTPRVLDLLEKHRARATFFVIGKAAERHPALVRKAAEAGNAIGVHSWDHPSFPSIPARERRRQILACEKAISPYGCRLFRPPYAHQTVMSRIDSLLLGYKVIMYNSHALDWEEHEAVWIARELEKRVEPGSITLLHDSLWNPSARGAEDRLPMIEALDIFLKRVCGRITFVTVPELLRLGRTQKRNWYVRDHNDW
jgi:peptidoglycan-N-acetylglucosamine deacetylase